MTTSTGERPATPTTPGGAGVPAPRRGDQIPARRPVPATGRPREDSRRARTAGPSAATAAERSASTADEPSFTTRWEAALTDLAVEVDAAEELLARLHRQAELPTAALRKPWTPPAGLGPLPLPLADRARALADRQVRAADALGRAMVLNRRQARAVDSLVDARARRGRGDDAVYLDVAL